MYIDSAEIHAALSRAEKKHGCRLSYRMADRLAQRCAEKYASTKRFILARQTALQEINPPFELRPGYKSVLGFIFGARGGHARRVA